MRKSQRSRKPLEIFDPSEVKMDVNENDENLERHMDYNPWNVTNFDAFLVYLFN